MEEHKNNYSPWTRGIPDTNPPEIIDEKEISENQAQNIQLKLIFNLHHNNEKVQCLYYDDEKKRKVLSLITTLRPLTM